MNIRVSSLRSTVHLIDSRIVRSIVFRQNYTRTRKISNPKPDFYVRPPGEKPCSNELWVYLCLGLIIYNILVYTHMRTLRAHYNFLFPVFFFFFFSIIFLEIVITIISTQWSGLKRVPM